MTGCWGLYVVWYSHGNRLLKAVINFVCKFFPTFLWLFFISLLIFPFFSPHHIALPLFPPSLSLPSKQTTFMPWCEKYTTLGECLPQSFFFFYLVDVPSPAKNKRNTVIPNPHPSSICYSSSTSQSSIDSSKCIQSSLNLSSNCSLPINTSLKLLFYNILKNMRVNEWVSEI